jgi:hypothetical protein
VAAVSNIQSSPSIFQTCSSSADLTPSASGSSSAAEKVHQDDDEKNEEEEEDEALDNFFTETLDPDPPSDNESEPGDDEEAVPSKVVSFGELPPRMMLNSLPMRVMSRPHPQEVQQAEEGHRRAS